MKPRLFFAFLYVLILAGCADPAPVINASCPAVRNWTKTQEAEAAREIASLPPNAILNSFMLDYGRMRAQSIAVFK